MGKLEGKVAIITGAAGSIGRKVAEVFLNEGAKVSLVDIDGSTLEEVKMKLEYENVLVVEANVSDEEDVENYVNQTLEKFGSVDILFNNAGIIGEMGPIHQQSLENFNKVLSVNTTAVFLGMKYVIPVMKKQKRGSIINTSSVDGLRGSPNMAPYSASKHGVVGLTKTASLEVAENNIRVNSIHPAPVYGNMMKTVHQSINKEYESQVEKKISRKIPLGYYANSKNIADLVLFLASDDSEYITGSSYRVDGGMGATS
ncbi:SDR family NAD(P)-dependent oxidoreductase [Sporosarcina ureilytica]|uniref:Oxidoreductase n=1 Tax=Sporosarcina ureilytica TaxID=298596 RepID=A0A1D8JFK1_9BACL|nr:SDR family NAD(P)-dependent oxidoreductase [Sporosarcina ureilytica]AOV07479.1 oxidoreductase [Sporosarcina ureilytica]